MVAVVAVGPLNLLISALPYFHPSALGESAYQEASVLLVAAVKPHM